MWILTVLIVAAITGLAWAQDATTPNTVIKIQIKGNEQIPDGAVRVLHPWDVAAGFLILEEAGGKISDLDNGPADRSGRVVVATNGPLHDALLSKLVRPMA